MAPRSWSRGVVAGLEDASRQLVDHRSQTVIDGRIPEGLFCSVSLVQQVVTEIQAAAHLTHRRSVVAVISKGGQHAVEQDLVADLTGTHPVDSRYWRRRGAAHRSLG
jgi:hypothetical protein